MTALIECVPNISEGRDMAKINAIAAEVEAVSGIKLLEIDAGSGANRSVITFVGPPDDVVEAAYRLIKKAAELIDMRQQFGEHPRIGATDVCPLIPISGITKEELIPYARKLGERVGRELKIPGYFYEEAATLPERKNLAYCRKGEYEGLNKLSTPQGKPDFGPAEFNDGVKKTGATVIGVRDFLIAYNVNLNTTDVAPAREIAGEVRESGRILKKNTDSKQGATTPPARIPGSLKNVKAIGWFIEEFGIAQVSLNLTNIHVTPVHVAFEEVKKKAEKKGIKATGSELVGLIPLRCLIEAGDFYLSQQGRNIKKVTEKEKVKIAIDNLGLNDVIPFDPDKKILEYVMRSNEASRLLDLSLQSFADKVSSPSYLPAGGSASAYCGALGAALGTMCANVSAHKKNWESKQNYFLALAAEGRKIQNELMVWVDKDTLAYQALLRAMAMPKETEKEIEKREKAIESASQASIEAPLEIAKIASKGFDFIKKAVQEGNKASVTDAVVGSLLLRAAIKAAVLNIQINIRYVKDKNYVNDALNKSMRLTEASKKSEDEIAQIAKQRLTV